MAWYWWLLTYFLSGLGVVALLMVFAYLSACGAAGRLLTFKEWL